MNSPSISWKRAIEIVLLNATMEFFNKSNVETYIFRKIFLIFLR